MKKLSVALTVIVGIAVNLGAQDPGRSAPVFRSGVDLVALNVIVTDAHERFVTDLQASDFAVFEDGAQQDISFFAASDVPLDIALLLDTSASMTEKLPTMRQAAIGFVSTVRPWDRISVIEIKDRVKTVRPLESDPEAAIEAISQMRASGGTSLYNALYITLKELDAQRKITGEVRRQAIVVFSDGDDTSSLVSFDDLLDVAKRLGIGVYTILLKAGPVKADGSGSRLFSQTEFAMKALAQETGARSFFPVQISELSGVYDTIAQELAHQYALGYISKNPKRDGLYRRLVVRVDRPDTRARARAGYLSSRSTESVTP